MTNSLASENSSYLLQHADNPVDWFPWGAIAFEIAKREDKPIFLSVGYAACHWCHVMAHESFEDPGIAEIMNQSFINIKVDREERPDIDSIYMDAVVAVTGQGGWPMSVFLTPSGEPFYGGTYFPPTRRYNLPAFKDVLLTVARLWSEDRTRLMHSAEQITGHIQSLQSLNLPAELVTQSRIDAITDQILENYDWQSGGWGKAPKFPQPMVIEFLLRRAARGDDRSKEVAIHALRCMAKGGMYDVIGGGFSRYSTDDTWLIPHFEKMLYDNAQLAKNYLHAYLISQDSFFKDICIETLDFVIREMSFVPNSKNSMELGFYSSLDADSEGVEGKYYLFDLDEISRLLGNEAKLFISAYGLTSNGNYDGKNILHRNIDDETLARQFQKLPEEVPSILQRQRQVLLGARKNRIHPATDDKAIAGWNGLMLEIFSEAGRYLDRSDYIDVAIKSSNFILNNLYVDNQLYRSWRHGKISNLATLEDYASLVIGLFSLYQTDPDNKWYRWTMKFLKDTIDYFADDYGLFFDTHAKQKDIFIRPKSYQDNATPSGNSLLAIAFLITSDFTAAYQWAEMANKCMDVVFPVVLGYSMMCGKWLCAFDRLLHPVSQIAIIGDPHHSLTKEYTNVLWSRYRPDVIAAIASPPVIKDDPPLCWEKPQMDGLPTAYVCREFVCQKPTNSITDFINQL